MFIIAAKTGWLTLSFLRIDRTCAGVIGFTAGGNGIVVVRSVSFACPSGDERTLRRYRRDRRR
jgi:hypothetical protein